MGACGTVEESGPRRSGALDGTGARSASGCAFGIVWASGSRMLAPTATAAATVVGRSGSSSTGTHASAASPRRDGRGSATATATALAAAPATLAPARVPAGRAPPRRVKNSNLRSLIRPSLTSIFHPSFHLATTSRLSPSSSPTLHSESRRLRPLPRPTSTHPPALTSSLFRPL